MVDIVRRLYLRPSRPEAQRAKDANIAATKDARGRRKLAKAAAKVAVGVDGDVGEREGWRRADYSGFARWYREVIRDDLLEGLSEDEQDKVRAAAWAAFHGNAAELRVWQKVSLALSQRHREAGELMRQRALSSRKRSSGWGSLPEGW